jgi:hypothetical protein
MIIIFTYGYPIILLSFIQKTVLSSLNSLWTFVEDWLAMYGWVYLYSLFYFIDLFVFLNSITSRYWLLYWILNRLLAYSGVSPPTMILVFKSVLTLPGPLHFYMSFEMSSSTSTQHLLFHWSLHWIDISVWEE